MRSVLLLLLAVLVPSGGVLWMMRQAMENERLAVRQRLADIYQLQLESAQQRVDQRWQERLTEMSEKAVGEPASILFAKFIAEGLADSAIVWGVAGEVQYPDRLPRSLPANAELRQLELLEPQSQEWIDVADKLRGRLNRYDSQRLSAPQRRFLMRRLIEQWPSKFHFATLEGELLAAEFLAKSDGKPPTAGLQPTPVEGVWSLHSSAEQVTALFRTSTLRRLVSNFLADQPLPTGIVLQPLEPGETLDSMASGSSEAMQMVSLAPALPGWRLAILANDQQLGNRNSSERVALFAWTALAVIGATLFLTWLVVRSWWQQMRVARLKNDLVATVSHELKTPLSSIRLLVDTLLDEDEDAPGRTREYLELISHENARLTRLIDNFLTFSRMERGKRHLELQPLDAREVIAQAVDAMQERFDAADNAELVVEANEPAPVRGDIDLLVTSVVNLLDNAWKYTSEDKRVVLSCKRQDGRVLISVQDNGIGLPATATEKVFGRFYQVDQRLSRTQGGCGLGLSIVKYLVEAHGGEVAVESQPGVGSIFSISLPLDESV
ncbi:MAG: HAMP domain-containing histidine kinase [Planctomycetes bacterium]|nr:HAMP domain-containing histidine kinase [Planctomycetota bacterium]